MGVDYEELLEKLKAMIKAKHRVSSSELVEWSESVEVGVVTLSLLIDDLKREGVIEASEESILVDEHLGIEIPRLVKLKGLGESKPRASAARRRRKVSRRQGEKGGLLKFLPIESTESKERGEEDQRIVVKQTPREPKLLEVSGYERDYLIALYYLSRYWSVGEIRLLMDLKNLGVENPEAVLRRLLEEGVVTRSRIGVVNANMEEVRRRLKDAPPLPVTASLTDLFK